MASSTKSEDVLTPEMILSRSGEFEIESVEILYFDHKHIVDLGALFKCKNLSRLDVSNNQISVISAMRGLKQLAYLNISSNRITNLDPLSGMENLEELNAAGNMIGSMDRLKCLCSIASLKKLRLYDGIKKLSNLVCDNDLYHKSTLKMLPQLMMLDGERVKGHGSDLYRICQELDEQMKSLYHEPFCPCNSCKLSKSTPGGRPFGPVVERPLPGPWFDSKQLTLPEVHTSSSNDIMEFQKVLRECKKADETASIMLDQFKSRMTTK
ncbi:leucine-rich repeat-containing protein 61 isoform X2 [Ciona intestinalis]